MNAEFVKKIIAAQSAMDMAHKNQSNPHFRAQYADLSSIMEATRPAFCDAGLAIIQSVRIVEDYANPAVSVSTTITDGTDSLEGGEIVLPVQGRSGKPTVQDYGATITYARRYSWQAATGVGVTENDPSQIDQSEPREAQPDNRSEILGMVNRAKAELGHTSQSILACLGISRLGEITDADAAWATLSEGAVVLDSPPVAEPAPDGRAPHPTLPRRPIGGTE